MNKKVERIMDILGVISIIILISIIAIIKSASAQERIEVEYANSELRRLNTLIDEQKTNCESAIIQYRSELDRVVEDKVAYLETEAKDFMKQAKFVIVFVIILSSFLGTTISSIIIRREEQKEFYRFMDKVCNILDSFEKDLINVKQDIKLLKPTSKSKGEKNE